MIFAVPGHIDLIREGLKTQSRRPNRGIYQIGRDYAVVPKMYQKAVPDIRIVMDDIWIEIRNDINVDCIAPSEAIAEGNYTVKEYTELYEKIAPAWHDRWVFEFRVIEVNE